MVLHVMRDTGHGTKIEIKDINTICRAVLSALFKVAGDPLLSDLVSLSDSQILINWLAGWRHSTLEVFSFPFQ